MCLSTTDDADGLCSSLVRPCPKVKPTRHDLSYNMKDQYEIPRSEVRMLKQLGAGNFGEVWEGRLDQRFINTFVNIYV